MNVLEFYVEGKGEKHPTETDGSPVDVMTFNTILTINTQLMQMFVFLKKKHDFFTQMTIF